MPANIGAWGRKGSAHARPGRPPASALSVIGFPPWTPGLPESVEPRGYKPGAALHGYGCKWHLRIMQYHATAWYAGVPDPVDLVDPSWPIATDKPVPAGAALMTQHLCFDGSPTNGPTHVAGVPPAPGGAVQHGERVVHVDAGAGRHERAGRGVQVPSCASRPLMCFYALAADAALTRVSHPSPEP